MNKACGRSNTAQTFRPPKKDSGIFWEGRLGHLRGSSIEKRGLFRLAAQRRNSPGQKVTLM